MLPASPLHDVELGNDVCFRPLCTPVIVFPPRAPPCTRGVPQRKPLIPFETVASPNSQRRPPKDPNNDLDWST